MDGGAGRVYPSGIMLTITYENRTGNALHTAIRGLRGHWVIINGVDNVEVWGLSDDGQRLLGERVSADKGVPTGHHYTVELNDVDTISV